MCATSHNATLHFMPNPNRYGTLEFNVTLLDSLGGETTSLSRLTIDVLPVNDPPTFRLATSLITVKEGSSCYTSLEDESQGLCSIAPALSHRREGFAISASPGPYEGGDAACHPSWRPCEDQTAQFVLVPDNATLSDALFSSMPEIDYPGGTLTFSLRPGGNTHLGGGG